MEEQFMTDQEEPLTYFLLKLWKGKAYIKWNDTWVGISNPSKMLHYDFGHYDNSEQ